MDKMYTFPKTIFFSVIATVAALLIVAAKPVFLALVILFVCLLVYFHFLKDFAFWQRNIIILLAGYFILPRGFSYIGFHIGHFYIFIGEIVIFLSLIFYNFKPVLKKLFKQAISKWLITWILLGFVLAVANIPKFRLISIARDYAMVYYSIFMLFGYAFYKDDKNLEIFYRILGWVFIFHTIWGLFYPFRSTIATISPRIMGIMPLFEFRQDADSVIFMGGILYFLLMAKQNKWPKLLAFLLAIVQFFLLFIFQMRAAYVGCTLVFLFLLIIIKKKILFKIAIVLTIILSLGVISNFKIEGRRGSKDIVSVRTIVGEFASIFTPQQSGTASFRLLWWKTIIKDGLQSPKLLFFGRGFGPSLGDRSYLEVGDANREDEEIKGLAKSPHNILITIFGRMGILGVILWGGINFTLFIWTLKGIKIAQRNKNFGIQNILIWNFAFVIMIVGTSLFGVLLESPFMAIPYYFFIGLEIAIVDRIIFDRKAESSNN